MNKRSSLLMVCVLILVNSVRDHLKAIHSCKIISFQKEMLKLVEPNSQCIKKLKLVQTGLKVNRMF